MHQGAVVGVIKGVCGGGLKVCIKVWFIVCSCGCDGGLCV